MPVCSSVTANYHHHNAWILDRYDLEKIKSFAVDSEKKGRHSIIFKCLTKNTYRKAVEHLFGVEGDAFQVVKAAARSNRSIDASKYTYAQNADLYTITIYFHVKEKKRGLLRSKQN